MRVAAGCVAVAALSALVFAPAPDYDPWAWLLWGREIAHGTLSTAEGPAFKPLPVAVCALLTPLGAGAAPIAWVIVARTGAVLAVVLAFRLGRRLGDGRVVVGVAAAAAVCLAGQYVSLAGRGMSEGWLLALALLGVERWRAGDVRGALACAAGAGLLRVETWPFLLLALAIAWRAGSLAGRTRSYAAAAAVLVPVAWFAPEYLGSGDLLRSGARARVPNPGQPATADVPFVASLLESLPLVPWIAWAGVALVVARGDAVLRGIAAAGGAWIVLVAAMGQAGFSGEARYAVPGAALVALAGAIALASPLRAFPWENGAGIRTRSPTVRQGVAGAVALVALALPHGPGIAELRPALAHQYRLQRDLPRAIDAAGGRDAVLRCGTPYVGPLRGPLAAYALDVPRHDVEPDEPPRPPGAVLRSRRIPGEAPQPGVPAGFARTAQVGPWTVYRACRV